MPPAKRPRVEATPQEAVDNAELSGGFRQQEGIISLWRTGKICDVILVVDGCSIPAHRTVLIANSSYFHGAFVGGGEHMGGAGGVDEHVMEDVKLDDLRSAVQFSYEGSCEVPTERLVDMLALSVRLGMTALKQSSTAQIVARLSADSCVGAWVLADKFDVPELGSAACAKCQETFPSLVENGTVGALMVEHMTALLTSDDLVVDTEADAFRALETWWRMRTGAQNDVSPSVEAMVPLVRAIRFNTMAKEFVRGHVRQSPLMQDVRLHHALTDVLLDGSKFRDGLTKFDWYDGENEKMESFGWRPTVGERLKLLTNMWEDEGTPAGSVVTIMRDDEDGQPFCVIPDAAEGVDDTRYNFVDPLDFDCCVREPFDEERIRRAIRLYGELDVEGDGLHVANGEELISHLREDSFPSRSGRSHALKKDS